MLQKDNKMQSAIIEFKKVMKAMSRKVLHLEEEMVKMKEESKENKNND